MGLSQNTNSRFITGRTQAGSMAYVKWKKYLSEIAAAAAAARATHDTVVDKESPEEAQARADTLRAEIQSKCLPIISKITITLVLHL